MNDTRKDYQLLRSGLIVLSAAASAASAAAAAAATFAIAPLTKDGEEAASHDLSRLKQSLCLMHQG